MMGHSAINAIKSTDDENKPVIGQLNRIDFALDQISNELSMLYARLEPIMDQHPTCDEVGAERKSGPMSPVANRASALADAAEREAARVRQIIRQLEI